MFAMTVDDVTDILQTSKHNFQSQAKHEHILNFQIVLRGKIFPSAVRIDMFLCSLAIWFWCLPYFCLAIMEVVIGFSMLKTTQNTEEDKTCEKELTCEKRKKHAEKSKRTEKEDRSRKREKGPKLHAAWWLNIKVEINFILFIEKLLEAFFAFQAFLYTLLGGL